MKALGAGLKELVFFKVFWDWSEMTILRAGLKWLLLFYCVNKSEWLLACNGSLTAQAKIMASLFAVKINVDVFHKTIK